MGFLKNTARTIVTNSSILSEIRRKIYFSKVCKKYNEMEKLYKTTDYADKIKKFKNKYYGKRCFIIGNGPSLKAEDLEMIKDEYSFAANRIHLMYDKTNWRPTFYMCQDQHMLVSECEHISSMSGYKFVAFNPMINNNLDIKGVMAYLLDDRDYCERTMDIGFSEDCSKSVFDASTVTYSSMQLAVYMGFKEIYLLGVDHRYKFTVDKNRKITEHKGVKTYFDDKYRDAYKVFEKKKGTVLTVYDMEAVNSAYTKAKKVAEKHNGAIYNATRGGDLEIYKRVNLEDLFKED